MMAINLEIIAAEASTLAERLTDPQYEPAPAQASSPQASARLERWRRSVERSGPSAFTRRLAWGGMQSIDLLPKLGAVQLADPAALPAWAATLGAVMQAAAAWPPQIAAAHAPALPTDAAHPLPFEDLLLPAVLVARRQLLARLAACHPPAEGSGPAATYPPGLPVAAQAYHTLERGLLRLLADRCARTFAAEFEQARPAGAGMLTLMLGTARTAPGRDHYQAFVRRLLSDGLQGFFHTYPVLGRIVATTIAQWAEATAELLTRLASDAATIQSAFGVDPGVVVAIQPALSDPHRHGRSVAAITFASGLELIYKPKAVGLELAYNQLLAWCNQQGAPLEFRVTRLIDRGEYGWVECIKPAPCDDQAMVGRFYRRAGMLLGLLYLLGATDCHHENLIASGEHLVLIDMETLMHPEVARADEPAEAAGTSTVIMQQFWDSVLRTGLLPRWEFEEHSRSAYDASGLGSGPGERRTVRAPRWQQINTDGMRLSYADVLRPLQANLPMLPGATLAPGDYLEEIVAGFAEIYQFLLRKRDELLATGGPLAALRNQRLRFVFRATQVYDQVLQRSLEPALLRSGVERSIELDTLSRAFLGGTQRPAAWPILMAELEAMERLDIPYFEVQASSSALTPGSGEIIEGYFQASGYRQILTRLQALGAVDLTRQIALIRGAFYARSAQAETPVTKGESLEQDAHDNPRGNQICLQQHDSSPLVYAHRDAHTPEVENAELIAEATRIGQAIVAQALRAPNGALSWVGLGYTPASRRFQLEPLGENLYQGSCGIALFLAALDYVRGSRQFRSQIHGALQPLVHFVQVADADTRYRFARSSGIGGAGGLGSLIYALVWLRRLLGDASLLEPARALAQLITAEQIAADRQLDIFGGAAGAILGLLALDHTHEHSQALDQAAQCGLHLLAQAQATGPGTAAWRTIAEQPLTGFSHGAAGIAYALLRLHAATGDARYLAVARTAIGYEQSLFDSTSGNWPDLRAGSGDSSQPGFMVSWCHGAAGIGLARLGGRAIYTNAAIEQDIEIALRTTQAAGLARIDHLCCGNAGRIELLQVAAERLGRPELYTAARRLATRGIERAEQAGGYRLFANLPSHVYHPGLFQGTAGIGYQLLRLAYPQALPAVLLWE